MKKAILRLRANTPIRTTVESRKDASVGRGSVKPRSTFGSSKKVYWHPNLEPEELEESRYLVKTITRRSGVATLTARGRLVKAEITLRRDARGLWEVKRETNSL